MIKVIGHLILVAAMLFSPTLSFGVRLSKQSLNPVPLSGTDGGASSGESSPPPQADSTGPNQQTSSQNVDPQSQNRHEYRYTQNSGNSSIDDLEESFKTSCKRQMDITEKCCLHPEQCLFGSEDSDNQQNTAVLGVMQAVLAGASSVAALSGACGKMKTLAIGVTAMNVALGGKCSAKINQCKKVCGSIAEEASEKLRACKDNDANCELAPIGNTNQYDQGEISKYKSRLNNIIATEDNCKHYENYSQAQYQQAIGSALTAQLMGLCKNAATDGTAIAAANAVDNFGLDCSSLANAANPACQNPCNRPGAESNPACQGAGGMALGTNSGSLNPNLVNPDGKTGTGGVPDEYENAQGAIGDGGTAKPGKIASTAGSGGIGGFGGGGDMGGGDGAPPSGPASAGYDPKMIGGGFRSGSGYMNPVGGRGPASAGGATAQQKGPDGKPFNPKDYLPGGPLDPKRKLAGLGNTADIGAVHGDIFKNITNRFYQICLFDRLYDCATLRKGGTQGN